VLAIQVLTIQVLTIQVLTIQVLTIQVLTIQVLTTARDPCIHRLSIRECTSRNQFYSSDGESRR
jgi:hypothetical protein